MKFKIVIVSLALFWNANQNHKYNHVREGQEDHEPYSPGKFALELLLYANLLTQEGRTFGGYKTYRDTQAQGGAYGRTAHCREQRPMTCLTENPCLSWFWRFSRLIQHNGSEQDQTRTYGAA